MMQAAAQLSQAMGQGQGGGEGGVGTMMQEPAMQMQTGTAAEAAGGACGPCAFSQ